MRLGDDLTHIKDNDDLGEQDSDWEYDWGTYVGKYVIYRILGDSQASISSTPSASFEFCRIIELRATQSLPLGYRSLHCLLG